MKINKASIGIVFILISCLLSCSREKRSRQTAIPNGDFENWNSNSLQNWETNSCPLCVPAFETYIVQQETGAYHGKYAAKFIYNNVYTAWAQNKFPVQNHPSGMASYVRCDLFGMDTVSITIKLFDHGVLVDSGQWLGTSSIANYKEIDIPITQNSANADTALIKIEGGHEFDSADKYTTLWVDYLSLR